METKEKLYSIRWCIMQELKKNPDSENLKDAIKIVSDLIGEAVPDISPGEVKPIVKGKTLGIVIGHTKGAGGAYSSTLKTNEYDLHTIIAAKCKAYGEKVGLNVIVETRDVGGVPGAYKRLLAQKPDACLELHFNAGGGEGTEVLFSDSFDKAGVNEAVFAGIILKKMIAAFGTKNRGLKRFAGSSGRGYQNVAQTTNVPSILTEAFFGDSKVDCAKVSGKYDDYARALVDGFAEFVREKKEKV